MVHVLFLVHLLLKMFKLNRFLHQTPIPSIEKETIKWVQGAPTPIQEGKLSPMTEALNLLVGEIYCSRWSTEITSLPLSIYLSRVFSNL